jgi:glyoxylase-like metal-dependent hydrolase (beta-lactamase superfamily II)
MKPIRIVTPPLGANTYLLLDEKPSLIDIGGSGEFIVKALQRHINPKEIEYVFLTHSHFDHAMAVVDFKKWFNCKVVMHKLEFELLKSGYSIFGYRFYVEPDITVDDGDVFELGELKLEVIHTPGHTMGSVCYYEPNKKWLFSGDTVFKYGFGRYDLPSGNAYELLKSLERLVELDVECLYPGHEDIVEGDAKKYIAKNLEVLRSVLF